MRSYWLMTACVGFGIATTGQAPAADPQNHLRIVNQCSATVWIQQNGLTELKPVVEIAAGQAHDYWIARKGVAATRFWPKLSCDSGGNNCAVGQSSPPCPANGGCAPPVDSKLEVTWGCLSDPSSCAINPSSGKPLDNSTWFNASLVDGFTVPFDVTVKSADGSPGCQSPATCPSIDYSKACPTADLSTDGAFPQYKNQNLQVIGPSKAVTGCFSACGKMTFSKFYGGHQLNPSDPAAAYYCCVPVNGKNPIPGGNPATSAGCNAGPAPTTSYVSEVHKACNNSVYAFAYDDTKGLRVCQGETALTFTLCP